MTTTQPATRDDLPLTASAPVIPAGRQGRASPNTPPPAASLPLLNPPRHQDGGRPASSAFSAAVQSVRTGNSQPVRAGRGLTREDLRARDDWRSLRCQECWGMGTVAAYSVYRPVGDDGTANPEDVGERLCSSCAGTGLGAEARALLQVAL